LLKPQRHNLSSAGQEKLKEREAIRQVKGSERSRKRKKNGTKTYALTMGTAGVVVTGRRASSANCTSKGQENGGVIVNPTNGY